MREEEDIGGIDPETEIKRIDLTSCCVLALAVVSATQRLPELAIVFLLITLVCRLVIIHLEKEEQ